MFRTELTIAPATGQLPRTARVLTMGSCFADSIGARLVAHKVETRVNPFGTVFQPLALARLLRAAAGEEIDWQQHLVQARGRWQSYDLHGSIGADSPVELLQYIQEVVRQTGEFLRNTDLVLLTLGTAWAYRLRETGELVSNCHKQPADLFVRELLTPDEIINALAETHAYLRRINPELRFVLTVSPVRHLKDTLPLNSVSKSVLRVATHIVSDLLPGVAYFPAFELLTDDLRDYRFYADDMLHPSEVAEDYIWDKFARTYFDADFGRFRKEWAAVRQSLGHRPLHEGAPEHRQFLLSTREKLEQLSLRNVDVADELRTVRARLEALPIPVQPTHVAEPEDDEERIDIGEAERGRAAESTTAFSSLDVDKVEQPPRSEGRPPRLSPEEFRAQRTARPERGRRDGRGKSQAVQPSETEQFQAASFAEADEFAQQPFLPEPALIDLTPVVSAAEAAVGDSDEADTEAGRKKKRRSRGGAKRTARKHALRLAAADVVLDEGQLAASEAALEAAAGEFANEASATSPAPAKNLSAAREAQQPRSNRRNDGGRGVGRVPLFAASAAPAADAAAESFADVAHAAGGAADVEPDAPTSSRKSRNRKKKKGTWPVITEPTDAGQHPTPAQMPRGVVEAVVDQEALNAARNHNRRGSRRPQDQPSALPVGGAAAAVVATPVALVLAPPVTSTNELSQPSAVTPSKAAKPSKRKSRAMVGGRAEKPAIDTPIIPVGDASTLRSQVAGGRLTGTSASLVEPTVPTKAGRIASAPKSAAAKPRKPFPAATKAPAASPTTEAERKVQAVPSAKPTVPAKPLPQSAAARLTKPAQKSSSAPSNASAAPKAPTKTVAAAASAKTVPTTAAKPKAKEAAKAANSTPIAVSQAASVSRPAGAKPARRALAIIELAAVLPAKPVSKQAVKPAAAAPKGAAVSKDPKPTVPAANKPQPAKEAAPKAAAAKPATAKPGTGKTKAPKKTAS